MDCFVRAVVVMRMMSSGRDCSPCQTLCPTRFWAAPALSHAPLCMYGLGALASTSPHKWVSLVALQLNS
eukprot:8711986-Pyramimonas_sp.AAC.1